MPKFEIPTGISGETLAKRMLKLAWDAASIRGMGFLQDRGPLNENQVWEVAVRAVDYLGMPNKASGSGKVNTDYLCGRMMKLYFNYTNTTIEYRDNPWRIDYQSFCHKYEDMPTLIEAALKSL